MGYERKDVCIDSVVLAGTAVDSQLVVPQQVVGVGIQYVLHICRTLGVLAFTRLQAHIWPNNCVRTEQSLLDV